MDAEVPTKRAFQLLVFWVLLGLALEFLFIPRHHEAGTATGNKIALFMSSNFYYVILSPAVFWWFFYHLVPAKEKELRQLGLKGVRLMNFILGVYLASVLRAILVFFFGLHLGVWG